MTDTLKRLYRKYFTKTSSIGAFLFMFTWTYVVNLEAILSSRLFSATVQGTMSSFVAILLIRMVEWLFFHLPKNRLRFVLPSFIMVSCLASTMGTIHYFIGTHNILLTITPQLTLGTLYCLMITYKAHLALQQVEASIQFHENKREERSIPF